MAEKYDFKIKEKIYDMVKYGYQALAQFPKSEKFALVADIKNALGNIMRYCVEGIVKPTLGTCPKSSIRCLDVENNVLRAYLKLAMELGFLPIKKYGEWCSMSVEIGKMTGGWLKYADKNPVKSKEDGLSEKKKK